MSQSHTFCKQICILAKFSFLICLVKVIIFLYINSFIMNIIDLKVFLKLTIKAVKYYI